MRFYTSHRNARGTDIGGSVQEGYPVSTQGEYAGVNAAIAADPDDRSMDRIRLVMTGGRYGYTSEDLGFIVQTQKGYRDRVEYQPSQYVIDRVKEILDARKSEKRSEASKKAAATRKRNRELDNAARERANAALPRNARGKFIKLTSPEGAKLTYNGEPVTDISMWEYANPGRKDSNGRKDAEYYSLVRRGLINRGYALNAVETRLADEYDKSLEPQETPPPEPEPSVPEYRSYRDWMADGNAGDFDYYLSLIRDGKIRRVNRYGEMPLFADELERVNDRYPLQPEPGKMPEYTDYSAYLRANGPGPSFADYLAMIRDGKIRRVRSDGSDYPVSVSELDYIRTVQRQNADVLDVEKPPEQVYVPVTAGNPSGTGSYSSSVVTITVPDRPAVAYTRKPGFPGQLFPVTEIPADYISRRYDDEKEMYVYTTES